MGARHLQPVPSAPDDARRLARLQIEAFALSERNGTPAPDTQVRDALWRLGDALKSCPPVRVARYTVDPIDRGWRLVAPDGSSQQFDTAHLLSDALLLQLFDRETTQAHGWNLGLAIIDGFRAFAREDLVEWLKGDR